MKGNCSNAIPLYRYQNIHQSCMHFKVVRNLYKRYFHKLMCHLLFQPCNCNPDGSQSNDCDPLTGQCTCRANYTGLQCDSCLYGSYNFPYCRQCRCAVEGTEPDTCNLQGVCTCTEPDGQCQCKVGKVRPINRKISHLVHISIAKYVLCFTA